MNTWDSLSRQIKDKDTGEVISTDTRPVRDVYAQAMIAPLYADLIFPVPAGQHCIYEGKLYVAAQGIQTSEVWTAAHWTEVKLGAQLADLKSHVYFLLQGRTLKTLVFNRYGLDRPSGNHNFDPTRLHTAITMCKEGDLVQIPAGYKYSLFYYTVANDYIGNSFDADGWYTADYIASVPYDCLLSVVIAKANDDTYEFTEQDCYALNNTVSLYSNNAISVGGIVFGAGHIADSSYPDSWSKLGDDWSFRVFASQKSLLTTRWRSENKQVFYKGATINVASGYRFFIFKYKDGTVTKGEWLTNKFVFDEDTTARVLVDTVSTSKTPYTSWPNLNDILFIENDEDALRLDGKIELLARDNKKRLHIGSFINGHLTASGVVDDNYTNYRISTSEIVALPYSDKATLKVFINSSYLFAMRVGATPNNLSSNLYWYRNGDVITIPKGCNYYAVSICKDSSDNNHMTYTISPNDDIGLDVIIQHTAPDIIAQNTESENILSSARLFFSESQLNTLYKYPVIAHTSDCHGDYERVKRFLDFCDSESVDVACVTGDIVSYKPSQGITWFNDLLLSHSVLPAICAGNHDVYDTSMSDADVYNFMFSDIADKIGNATGKTWYYKDITDKMIRIISINHYQFGGSSRWYTHYTDEQLSWLVATLNGTPNGYGVVIISHASQTNLDNARDSNYAEFFQTSRLYNNTHNAVSGGVPLYDIVDAFISRSTLSKTYTQTGSPASVSVSADFTNVDSSIEFVAHLTGHFHQDSICYVPGTTNKQLMLNVTCTNAVYGGSEYPYFADIQDQGRYNMDMSQDAFNIYIIDRDNKTVKVVRVGNNKTYQMDDRKYMVIPYAD